MEPILNLDSLLKQAMEADVTPLRQFLTTNPGQPLVATGSGGAESVADFAALLYGARGGMATAVSPYTLNSYSDEALKRRSSCWSARAVTTTTSSLRRNAAWP